MPVGTSRNCDAALRLCADERAADDAPREWARRVRERLPDPSHELDALAWIFASHEPLASGDAEQVAIGLELLADALEANAGIRASAAVRYFVKRIAVPAAARLRDGCPARASWERVVAVMAPLRRPPREGRWSATLIDRLLGPEG